MDRRRGRLGVGVLVAIAATIAVVQVAVAAQGNGPSKVRETLSGYEEVPAISSTGGGEFHATIAPDGKSMTYELTYGKLEGDVLQAHIHLAQADVNGGIVLYLCSNLAAPAGVPLPPACPASGTVTGELDADDVFNGAAAQGIGDDEFAEIVQALRAGKTYVNVHSSRNPGGEIRAQIEQGGGR